MSGESRQRFPRGDARNAQWLNRYLDARRKAVEAFRAQLRDTQNREPSDDEVDAYVAVLEQEFKEGTDADRN